MNRCSVDSFMKRRVSLCPQSISELSEDEEDDESVVGSKVLSFEDDIEEEEDSPSEGDLQMEQRGVPIELSTAEEEQLERDVTQNQLHNILQEVQQEAARVNGHPPAKDAVSVNGENGQFGRILSELSQK